MLEMPAKAVPLECGVVRMLQAVFAEQQGKNAVGDGLALRKIDDVSGSPVQRPGEQKYFKVGGLRVFVQAPGFDVYGRICFYVNVEMVHTVRPPLTQAGR